MEVVILEYLKFVLVRLYSIYYKSDIFEWSNILLHRSHNYFDISTIIVVLLIFIQISTKSFNIYLLYMLIFKSLGIFISNVGMLDIINIPQYYGK